MIVYMKEGKRSIEEVAEDLMDRYEGALTRLAHEDGQDEDFVKKYKSTPNELKDK